MLNHGMLSFGSVLAPIEWTRLEAKKEWNVTNRWYHCWICVQTNTHTHIYVHIYLFITKTRRTT